MGVHVCCCRSKARMTPCSLVRKKADVQPGVSITLPNSKTISSGMALWQTFTSFSCGSQLKSKTISLGMAFFTADIHLFQQWVCLSQPKSKTVSSRMALWQTFSCGSLTSRLSSGMTSLQTHTGFSCGSLTLPNFKTVLSGKTLLQTFTSVFQLWVSHSAKVQDCFVR